MRNFLTAAIPVSLSLLLAGCLAKRLEDQVDDAFRTDGDLACQDVWDDLLSNLDSCRNGTLLNGAYSGDVAAEYCDDNCDDLGNDVSYDSLSECQNAIMSLDCDGLEAAYENGSDLDLDACGWLDDRLDC